MSTLTLDSGALIAFQRADRTILAIIVVARERRQRLLVPAGVVAQTWRDGRKQVRLARLLGSETIEIEPLTDRRARAAGQLCGVTKTTDIVDASVALCARAHGGGVATSDPDDLIKLDPSLRIVRV